MSLRSDAPEVTLSRLAGGEYLPLRRSEGAAFPSRSAALGHELGPNGAHDEACSPAMGPHFSRESLMDKGVLPANRKTYILSRSCENRVGKTEETPKN